MCAYRRPDHAAAAGDAIPFYFDGEVHLFYLSSPPGTLDYPERVRTTWQHAKSADLVRWEELPPALGPGSEGSVDGGGIWTGSVVEREGMFYLFYTGHHVDAEHPQTICLATSTDLVTFTRHPSNPLLLPTPDCEPVDWRDPYVFYNEQERTWWMLIAARASEGPHWRRGVIKLATSDDLLNWTVEDEPLYSPGTTYCPECPELWQANDLWYLVYSAFSEDVGTTYRTAESPRGPFRTPAHAALGGRRWYAAKSAPFQGERAFFGWVHDRVDENGSRWLWGGDFALPRLVAPDPASGLLRVRPAPGVVAEFGEPALVASSATGAAGVTSYLDGGMIRSQGKAIIELTAANVQAAEVGIGLEVDPLGSGWRVSVDPRRARVSLSREPRPLDDFWADLTHRSSDYREVDGPFLAWADLPAAVQDVELAILLDGDLLEIYVNEAVALTHRVERTDDLRVRGFVTDGAADTSLRIASFNQLIP